MTWPSRDSWVWWFGLVSSAVVAVAANFDLFPWLPDHVKHALSLTAFIIGATSGKMATSPARSKAEQQKDAAIDDALRSIQ